VDSGVERVLQAVRAGGLLLPDAPVVVLLSGGRDSVCLLDLAVRVAGPAAVTALHVNYGLRDEADGDEAHSRALCEHLGVELVVERPQWPGGGNVQAWARDVRYGAAASLALARGARVAAGHTASDQAETVLYRLATSPGRRALLGMRARDGSLVRPLLAFSREQTTSYCRARGLAWRDDVTNDGDVFARARVRNTLLPALRSLHPAAERNVVRTAALLRDEAEVLEAAVAGVLAGADHIGLARLAALEAPLRRLVVRRLAEDAAGRHAPDAGARIDELLALAGRGGSAQVHLGGGLRALVEYGELRFTVAPAQRAAAGPVELPVPGIVRFGEFEVRCAPCQAEPRAGVLDADALADQLTVRVWRDGDRMAPLGLGGSKSLQDLFTDRHVPRERRHDLPVIESAGEIACIPGVATGERFRVTDHTAQAVRLSARRAA